MKKNLLSLVCALVFSTTLIQAQNYVWNFGNDVANFPISAGYSAETTIAGLTIFAGGTTTNMGQIDKSNKTFNEVLYNNRFKFNGAGYSGAKVEDVAPTVNMPTQRYVSFSVDGDCSVTALGVTASSAQDRRVFVTDGTNLVGTMLFLAGTEISEQRVEYVGAAATLYMFCNQAVNLYYLEVIDPDLSSIHDVNADRGAIVSSVYYDLLGKQVSAETKGLVLIKATYEDGSVETLKQILR